MTGKWYQEFYGRESTYIAKFTSRQIEGYAEIATQANLSWTQ